MSTTLHLSLHEYNRMVDRGAFDELNRKIELIRGEVVEMNPAGPVHDDYIDYLMDWSFRSTDRMQIRVRGQTGINRFGCRGDGSRVGQHAIEKGQGVSVTIVTHGDVVPDAVIDP